MTIKPLLNSNSDSGITSAACIIATNASLPDPLSRTAQSPTLALGGKPCHRAQESAGEDQLPGLTRAIGH